MNMPAAAAVSLDAHTPESAAAARPTRLSPEKAAMVMTRGDAVFRQCNRTVLDCEQERLDAAEAALSALGIKRGAVIDLLEEPRSRPFLHRLLFRWPRMEVLDAEFFFESAPEAMGEGKLIPCARLFGRINGGPPKVHVMRYFEYAIPRV